jgi:hypothetical protein
MSTEPCLPTRYVLYIILQPSPSFQVLQLMALSNYTVVAAMPWFVPHVVVVDNFEQSVAGHPPDMSAVVDWTAE